MNLIVAEHAGSARQDAMGISLDARHAQTMAIFAWASQMNPKGNDSSMETAMPKNIQRLSRRGEWMRRGVREANMTKSTGPMGRRNYISTTLLRCPGGRATNADIVGTQMMITGETLASLKGPKYPQLLMLKVTVFHTSDILGLQLLYQDSSRWLSLYENVVEAMEPHVRCLVSILPLINSLPNSLQYLLDRASAALIIEERLPDPP